MAGSRRHCGSRSGGQEDQRTSPDARVPGRALLRCFVTVQLGARPDRRQIADGRARSGPKLPEPLTTPGAQRSRCSLFGTTAVSNSVLPVGRCTMDPWKRIDACSFGCGCPTPRMARWWCSVSRWWSATEPLDGGSYFSPSSGQSLARLRCT